MPEFLLGAAVGGVFVGFCIFVMELVQAWNRPSHDPHDEPFGG